MSAKRKILYSTYKLLKATGYISLMNSLNPRPSVLMYHRVNENLDEEMTVHKDEFEKMIKVFSQNYKVISLVDLIAKLKKKEKLDSKTIVITFDDGYKDNYEYAAPILKKYGLPATFFVTSGYIDTKRIFEWDKVNPNKHDMMTWDDVRDLSRLGFDIGSHTVNHVNLGKVDVETAITELTKSKQKIENELNKEIRLFAYPFGRMDCIRDEVVDVVKNAGYDCCCSGYGGKIKAETDVYNIYRVGGAYPNTLELLMEVDNFMTYYNGRMSINLI